MKEKTCPICERKTFTLAAHINTMHPNSIVQVIDMPVSVQVRHCESCGYLLGPIDQSNTVCYLCGKYLNGGF